jgi:hypothetical protein
VEIRDSATQLDHAERGTDIKRPPTPLTPNAHDSPSESPVSIAVVCGKIFWRADASRHPERSDLRSSQGGKIAQDDR